MIRIILEYDDDGHTAPLDLFDRIMLNLLAWIKPRAATLEVTEGRPYRRVYKKPPTRWLDLDGVTHRSDET